MENNQKTIELEGKIWKSGKDSYVISVPKAFIKAGLFKVGEKVNAKIDLWDKPQPIKGRDKSKDDMGTAQTTHRNEPLAYTGCFLGGLFKHSVSSAAGVIA